MGKKPLKANEIFQEGRLAVIVLMIIISAVLILLPKARANENSDLKFNVNYAFEKCKIIAVNNDDLEEDPIIDNLNIGRQQVKLKIITGKFKGTIVNIENTISRMYNYQAKEGMTMVVNITEEDGKLSSVNIFSYSRGIILYVLIGLFFLILIIVGRNKGFYAILSLIFMGIVVIYYMIPMILRGQSPILLALVTAGVTTVASITVISGINKKSLSAIIGIILGLMVAVVTSAIFGHVTKLSGLSLEYAEEMILLANDSKLVVRELLFAGIIISALGAIMDVGMSIAASVFEVHATNSKLSMRELYKSGMNVGRDVMGTMTNTLILAFAGSSLNVLILLYMYHYTYLRFINLDIIGIEILQGIAGSIGLVLTVPITAWVAAVLAKKQ